MLARVKQVSKQLLVAAMRANTAGLSWFVGQRVRVDVPPNAAPLRAANTVAVELALPYQFGYVVARQLAPGRGDSG
jgi:hypothetical protein